MHHNYIHHIRSSTKRKCHGHPSWRRDRQGFFSLYLCLIKIIYSISFSDATDDYLQVDLFAMLSFGHPLFGISLYYLEITYSYFWYHVTCFIFIGLFFIRSVYLLTSKWMSISDMKYKYDEYFHGYQSKNIYMFLVLKTNWNKNMRFLCILCVQIHIGIRFLFCMF